MSLLRVVNISDGTDTLQIDNSGNISANIMHAKSTALKVTIGAGGTQTVKASAGYVFAVNTALSDLLVKNDTTEVWVGNYSGSQPFYCNTSIKLSSVTGGTAYIVYL